MEEVNKNTELNDTDKKLHISDVSCSSISRDDINKQAYLVMSNINATKIMTNISDSNHETLMNSFFTLQGMFNEYLKQNGID
jgi:ribosomal protein L11 methylase PrmA